MKQKLVNQNQRDEGRVNFLLLGSIQGIFLALSTFKIEYLRKFLTDFPFKKCFPKLRVSGIQWFLQNPRFQCNDRVS